MRITEGAWRRFILTYPARRSKAKREHAVILDRTQHLEWVLTVIAAAISDAKGLLEQQNA
jgi:hypothetical protein